MFAGILKEVSIRKSLLHFGIILHSNPIIFIPLFHPCFILTPLVCISSPPELYSFQTAFSSVLFIILAVEQTQTQSFPKLSAVTNKCWSPGATHRAAALPIRVCVAAVVQCLFKLSGLWVMSLNDDCGACRCSIVEMLPLNRPAVVYLRFRFYITTCHWTVYSLSMLIDHFYHPFSCREEDVVLIECI